MWSGFENALLERHAKHDVERPLHSSACFEQASSVEESVFAISIIFAVPPALSQDLLFLRLFSSLRPQSLRPLSSFLHGGLPLLSDFPSSPLSPVPQDRLPP